MSDKTTNHLANNRTFLSWIRTSLGIMAFGFVIERFTLFTKQVSILITHYSPPEKVITSINHFSSSAFIGILLVFLGVVISLLAYFQFLLDQKKIEAENYQPTNWLYAILTGTILLMGIFLVFYLNQNFVGT